MPRLILYGRLNCSHCEQLKFALELLRNHDQAPELQYDYVDVDSDSALRETFGSRVPVLLYGEQLICEGIFNVDTLSQDVMHAINATP